jgi:hypothetical protein
MSRHSEIGGSIGTGADLRELVAQRIRRQHCAGKRTEPARRAHSGHELEVHRAGHRSQHDRMFDAEKLGQSGVGPTSASPLNTVQFFRLARELRA